MNDDIAKELEILDLARANEDLATRNYCEVIDKSNDLKDILMARWGLEDARITTEKTAQRINDLMKFSRRADGKDQSK